MSVSFYTYKINTFSIFGAFSNENFCYKTAFSLTYTHPKGAFSIITSRQKTAFSDFLLNNFRREMKA